MFFFLSLYLDNLINKIEKLLLKICKLRARSVFRPWWPQPELSRPIYFYSKSWRGNRKKLFAEIFAWSSPLHMQSMLIIWQYVLHSTGSLFVASSFWRMNISDWKLPFTCIFISINWRLGGFSVYIIYINIY